MTCAPAVPGPTDRVTVSWRAPRDQLRRAAAFTGCSVQVALVTGPVLTGTMAMVATAGPGLDDRAGVMVLDQIPGRALPWVIALGEVAWIGAGGVHVSGSGTDGARGPCR